MTDFDSDLKKQLAREADSVQQLPRDLAARIVDASGPRPALWLRLAPAAVALLFVAALGAVFLRQDHPSTSILPAAVASGTSTAPSSAAATQVPSEGPSSAPQTASPSTPATSPAVLAGFACGSGSSGGQTIHQPAADGSGNLTAVRVAHQAGFDRVTFEFAGATLPQYTISLQQATTYMADPSGQSVTLSGNNGLKVVFQGASERDLNQNPTYTGSNDIILPPSGAANAIAELRMLGDFERVLSWAAGLNSRPDCNRVLQLSSPTRLVIDVQQQP
jgi:hypothetical protein